MLRLIVLLLLLANGVYFAWSHRYLEMYGFAPHTSNEPQRLQQQIKPEAVQVLSASDMKKAEAQAQAEAAPKECLQAGPFSDDAAVALRKALDAALPSGSWQLESAKVSARWVVYMGKFASEDLLTKKKAELTGMGIKSEPVHNSEFQPGLVLAGFETEAAAKSELAKLAPKGIRTAKVVQEREAGAVQQLKLPAVNEALKAKLQELKPVLQGHPLKACS
ncbi:SPOR domain-containing protein [Rhodoferax sp.]|uniref:SPOR domain-containing protein n=1 Tax=Rhodoferax sp. TaxID=50421 RepID=UPI0025F1FD83|nr:SPOR domain-containing protein [Rhodoferax sp.]